MRTKMLVSSFAFVASLSAGATSEINYNRGFCVEVGKPLSEENAVVRVSERKLNDHYLMLGQEHGFFGINGTKHLHAFDWGGSSDLVRLASDFEHHKNLAVFSDNTHDVSHNTKPVVVECIAAEAIENF